MSAIGTDRLCRQVREQFRCWSLTGTATAVAIFLSLTLSGPRQQRFEALRGWQGAVKGRSSSISKPLATARLTTLLRTALCPRASA
jgi:hypothetical protein